MRIRFLATMPERGYSGGRMLALTVAEALAQAGAEVDFLTNSQPQMHEEFKDFSRIQLVRAGMHDLSVWADSSVNLVVIVPGQGHVPTHVEFLRHAIECRAKVVLVNFESPNWFNAMSPQPRSHPLWHGWQAVAQHSDLIWSISEESNLWAQCFYHDVPTHCQFDSFYTPINHVLADQAEDIAMREKRVLVISRIDGHKGIDNLFALATPALSGYTVSLCSGMSQHALSWLQMLKQAYSKHGITLDTRQSIPSLEKFQLMKSSAFLYFPTLFEGFGIPPLEAAYCKLPVLCNDLRVLREFGQDAFHYVNVLNPHSVAEGIERVLAEPERIAADHARFSAIARMDHAGKRMLRQLSLLAGGKLLKPNRMAHIGHAVA